MREYRNRVSTEAFQRLLIDMEYEALAITNTEMYDLAVEEQQVEQWVYAMSLTNLKKEAESLNFELELTDEQKVV